MMKQPRMIFADLRSSRSRVTPAAAPSRRGVAALEMALVLPLLLLILLGAIDLGRFAHSQIAVANAARVGAGVGSATTVTTGSREAWEANIYQAVQSEMEGVRGFDRSRLTVSTTIQIDSDARQRVQVVVTYPFTTLGSWPFIPSSLPLKQVAAFPMIR